MQRAFGNRAVTRLLPRTSPRLPIQAKLTVNPAGDQYEQEADRLAEQVVGQISAPPTQTVQPFGELRTQRQEEEEEEIQAKSIIQRQEEELQMQPAEGIQRLSSEGGGSVAPELEDEIHQARGGGQHLSGDVREPMEQAFGADFSGVRVHTNRRADDLNESLQARAFTTGRDIFFRSGEYDPRRSAGQRLLAHELTHVVQQGGATGVVMRMSDDRRARFYEIETRYLINNPDRKSELETEGEAWVRRKLPYIDRKALGTGELTEITAKLKEYFDQTTLTGIPYADMVSLCGWQEDLSAWYREIGIPPLADPPEVYLAASKSDGHYDAGTNRIIIDVLKNDTDEKCLDTLKFESYNASAGERIREVKRTATSAEEYALGIISVEFASTEREIASLMQEYDVEPGTERERAAALVRAMEISEDILQRWGPVSYMESVSGKPVPVEMPDKAVLPEQPKRNALWWYRVSGWDRADKVKEWGWHPHTVGGLSSFEKYKSGFSTRL
jgi:hypothetical protein